MTRLVVAFAVLLTPWSTLADTVATVPLHHFYQPKSDFHLYTAKTDEITALNQDANWKHLGTVGHVFARRTPQTVELYRLSKMEYGGDNHFFTVDMQEANKAITEWGWSADGVGAHIAPTQLPGTIPLYRLYKPCVKVGMLQDRCAGVSGDVHVYTTVESEKDSGLANGYQLVRVEGYVWANPGVYPNVDPAELAKAIQAGAKTKSQAENEEPPKTVPRIPRKEGPDDGRIPLNLTLRDRRDSAGGVEYDIVVSNANQIPRDWFKPLTLLPPDPCWGAGRPSNARLFLEISWGPDDNPNRRGECRPILTQPELTRVLHFTLPKDKTAASLRVTLRDRLTEIRHTSNVVPVNALGVADVLVPLGCFVFLGRSDEFVCKTPTGVAACENLKRAGKVKECRGSATRGK